MSGCAPSRTSRASVTRKLEPRKWQLDHIVALINGGENRERNLWPLCTSPCHSRKAKLDLAEKSRVYHRAVSHIGTYRREPQIRSRGFPQPEPQNTACRPIRSIRPS
ncbi:MULTISPECIES: HNH endonuclease [Bradyrhizobium]|uniref:HNH endonuclease n=1 Tax=Bradyrhizobium TaxID=374 RepID=UPI001448AFAD|nr:HNH endonuclease [Bradyrhizobium sp. BRP56]QOZ18858.1 hypothetical protein XI02_30325 [Bradyrhizobium sp. CCBAU 21365]BBB98559.1 hypothetical protein BE61_39990 [Bradyrhizobium elkanii USDA 61]